MSKKRSRSVSLRFFTRTLCAACVQCVRLFPGARVLSAAQRLRCVSRLMMMLLLLLFILSEFACTGVEAGCADRVNPKCCSGRDNGCYTRGHSGTRCYCDAYCPRAGDCCEDYPRVCHVSAIDCMLGPWGPWSECSSPCGAGSKERSRLVTVPPHNGGAPCPDLRQRRGCFGEREHCSSAREVARILPDSFSRGTKDPWRRPHMLVKEVKPSYCVWLRVKQTSLACKLHRWRNLLTKEHSICAECQGDAMGPRDRCTGEGLQGQRTFWTAAAFPSCHGSWVRESFTEQCHCPPHSVLLV